jgi:hypothetical protein
MGETHEVLVQTVDWNEETILKRQETYGKKRERSLGWLVRGRSQATSLEHYRGDERRSPLLFSSSCGN